MRKRFLSLALALVMCLGLMTVPASAAGSVEVLYNCEYAIHEFVEGIAFVMSKPMKYGFIDESGKEIAPGMYKSYHEFHEGLALVTLPDYTDQYVDKNNNVAIPPIDGLIFKNDCSEGLIHVSDNNRKHGFMDKTGKMVIELTYDGAGDFKDGLAPVYDATSGYWGYIDKTGKEVIPFQYTEASNFSDGMACVYSKSRGRGYVNTSGQEIAMGEYKEVGDFSDGTAIVHNYFSGEYFLIDKTGKQLTIEYDKIYPFYNGLAIVDADSGGHIYGFIDKTGKEVIPCQFSTVPYAGFDPVSVVTNGSIAGILTKDGQFTPLPEGLSLAEEYIIGYGIGGGLIAVKNAEDRVGYVDTAGNLVVPCKYKAGTAFSAGYAAVADFANKWCFIDAKGNEITGHDYVEVTFLQDGYGIAAHRAAGDGNYDWDLLRFTPLATQTTQTPQPPAPAGITATPTSSTVLVNGAQKSFDAYNINGANYFKLRDLAFVLSGTEKQFQVGWDSASKTIALTSGQGYTSVGGEMASGGGKAQTATVSNAKLLVDGKEVSLTAYTIGGANYFMLRDIGTLFDFGVGWDNASKTITIDTSVGYTA